MISGKVKWFSDAKGYGFIIPDDQEFEVFVHFRTIEVDGKKSLKSNQRVKFELEQSYHGWHTTRVIPIEEKVTAQ